MSLSIEKVFLPAKLLPSRCDLVLSGGLVRSCNGQVTGGRNGYGAKLANIFSTEFVIETCDGRRKRAYRQVFSANMTTKGEPEISPCKVNPPPAANRAPSMLPELRQTQPQHLHYRRCSPNDDSSRGRSSALI